MIITFEPALPCAQLTAAGTVCHAPATSGVIAPAEGDVYELLPVCAAHFDQALREASAADTLPPMRVREAGRNEH